MESIAGDLTIHYELRGQGPPLLLLHGFTGSGADWVHAGRDELAESHQLIIPDARGHGRTENPSGEFSHRLCAKDTLALLDALGIDRVRAIGASMGGNTLLHMATERPKLIEAMILVSATMYFPEQARAIMRDTTAAISGERSAEHAKYQRGFATSHDDMSFTPPELATIRARTLIVYGDRDPLYPVEMGVTMYRAIPGAALWIVPGGSHLPIFGAEERADFLRVARRFLAGQRSTG